MERTPEHISVWFWPRNSNTVPNEVKRNTIFPISTQNWVSHNLPLNCRNHHWLISKRGQGIPAAFFPNTSCDITKFFGPNNIIINLTFCKTFVSAFMCYSSANAHHRWRFCRQHLLTDKLPLDMCRYVIYKVA